MLEKEPRVLPWKVQGRSPGTQVPLMWEQERLLSIKLQLGVQYTENPLHKLIQKSLTTERSARLPAV